MSAGKEGRRAFPGSGMSPWHWLALASLFMLFMVAAQGCGGGGDEGGGDPVDESIEAQMRQQFLQSIGSGFIVPTYAELEAQADQLARTATAFCATPSFTSLEAVQDQWRRVMGLWAESELVNFGPAKEGFIENNIDVPRRVTHADAEDIESRIAGNQPISSEHAGSWPVDEIGLKGIEYLLFGDPGEGNAILDTSHANWQRRCNYLEAVTMNLHDSVGVILDRWQPDEGNFISIWNTAGDPGNTTYFDVQDAVDDLMEQMELVIDYLVNVNLWSVNWVRGKAESWRSGNSIANIVHRIEAARKIYLGEDRRTNENQFGIDDYLTQGGHAGLDQQIQDQFEATLDALGTIPSTLTLTEAVVSHGDLVSNIREEVARELLKFLKRRLAEERLGVPIEDLFSSEDGD